MKKIIVLVIFIIILVITSILITINHHETDTDVISFYDTDSDIVYFSYHGSWDMSFSYIYTIEINGDDSFLSGQSSDSTGYYIVKKSKIDPTCLSEIKQLLIKYDASSWNGYKKSYRDNDPYAMGERFSF